MKATRKKYPFGTVPARIYCDEDINKNMPLTTRQAAGKTGFVGKPLFTGFVVCRAIVGLLASPKTAVEGWRPVIRPMSYQMLNV
jgi:hypothetical protein